MPTRPMPIRSALLATGCALALGACGNRNEPAAEAPASTATAPAPAPEAGLPPPATSAAAMPAAGTLPPAATTAPTPAATATAGAAAPAAADNGKPAAVVSNCATTIEGNDAMQYNVGSIVVPASCKTFKITLRHTGTMPVAAMGHDVVISTTADMQGVVADGMGAGLANGYVKPNDTRVVAHTSLVGGGQTTSTSVDVAKLKTGGPYMFFCSFPGHAAVMKGPISVQQQ